MITLDPVSPVAPDAKTKEFYVDALRTLDEAEVPYVVGGGYAMAYYTGIQRNTKDLDLFVKPEDHERILAAIEKADAAGASEILRAHEMDGLERALTALRNERSF